MTPLDQALWARRAVLVESEACASVPALGRSVACSDDLWIAGARLLVRAFLRPQAHGLAVDLRDSSPARDGLGCIDADDVRTAVTFALADALEVPATRALAQSIAIETDDASWVGAARATDDAAARLFAMARVYDAVSGALALAWPERARAVGCSLGAIVMTHGDDAEHAIVVPGGRGASTTESGTHAWPGPLLPAGVVVGPASAALDLAARPGCGGGGARVGGDGCVATLHVSAPLRLKVAIDRLGNPPHGLDRAGPPDPAALVRRNADGEPLVLRPWTWTVVQPGERVEIHTAGGAGHGFGGYGIDVSWE
jgi:N-methylhydantoinase B/oxoprolinase/acetone carboxylase alpha subunit